MGYKQGVLTVVSAECFPALFSFYLNIAHSIASRSYTENVIVKLYADEDFVGYGECVPRTYVTGETVESVLNALKHIIPFQESRRFSSSDEILDFLRDIGETDFGLRNPSALCALDLAFLDLAGKYSKISVSAILGANGSNELLTYSLVVPLLDNHSLDAFLMRAQKYGFLHVKMKVNAHDPASRIRIARNCLGDSIEIRVDANCSWNRDNAPVFMKELAEFGVVSVEQPLAPEDLEGSAMLKKEGIMLITLDESVASVDDVRRAAASDACDVVNVRISKCGGLVGSMKVIDAASREGLKVQLGSHVGESCILSAAGAHLARTVGSFLWLEGCYSNYLLKKGVCNEQVHFGYGGSFTPLRGPGLGIQVNENLIMEAKEKYYQNHQKLV